MSIQRLKYSLLSTLVLLSAGAAKAADYAPPPPPMIVQQPAEEFGSSWYLRGQVGIGMNTQYTLTYVPAPANVGNGFAFEHSDFTDSIFLGFGVGYEWNNWFRTDVTLDYRSKARVFAWGIFDQVTGFGDTYQGYISSWVFLANAYIDLGTWNCITPFVGVGVGTAHNQMSDFTDLGFGVTGRGMGRNSSNWSPAWALHAGLAYSVTKNFKFELAYRYLNYGSVTETVDCVGGCFADSYKFDKLASHDIMLALRWNIGDYAVAPAPAPTYVAPPVYTPPPVYQQPPVYSPPPLRSRG